MDVFFSAMCAEMGKLHHNLLLHTEARRLSKGKVLNCIFELCESLKVFLDDQMYKSTDRFSEENWLAWLAYLADIFDHLNQLILAGKGTSQLLSNCQTK